MGGGQVEGEDVVGGFEFGDCYEADWLGGVVRGGFGGGGGGVDAGEDVGDVGGEFFCAGGVYVHWGGWSGFGFGHDSRFRRGL